MTRKSVQVEKEVSTGPVQNLPFKIDCFANFTIGLDLDAILLAVSKAAGRTSSAAKIRDIPPRAWSSLAEMVLDVRISSIA